VMQNSQKECPHAVTAHLTIVSLHIGHSSEGLSFFRGGFSSFVGLFRLKKVKRLLSLFNIL